jgi:transcriptional regulator with XRE-family HTH domain
MDIQQFSPSPIVVRAAVALRAARTGLGWSQETAAQHSGLSKTTIARIETLVGQISLENVHILLDTYARHGVEISELRHLPVHVSFGEQALTEAAAILTDPSRKRSDAGKRRGRPRKTPPAEDGTGGAEGGDDPSST